MSVRRVSPDRPGLQGSAGLPWTPRDDHRPERLRPPPHPLGVQPARRAGADHGPRRHVDQARLRLARRHRPRRALRIRRVLPGGDQGGHQADHRRRDLRRPADDGGPRPARRQPAVPPDPAGDRPRRLPEPVPAAHRRPHRRLLLQAAHRPRAPRQATARASSGLSACLGGEIPKALEAGGLGPRAHRSPASTATSWARTASSSSSRTTASRSSSASTSSCSGSRPRSACRSSSPTTCTTSIASSTRRTTSCCASAPATTSTRRTG